jgi:S-(hydroxymethyl)glutathione dehydrogenase/alcohol dehydrogenase
LKAAVLFECGTPLRILTDIEAPSPQRGQVFVKLSHSGICHSQLMEVRGARGPDNYRPHLLGHEGTAIVVSVGEGVTKVSPGDRVVLGWIKGQGLDAEPIQYRWQDLILNAGGVTTFNSHALVAENRCYRLPDDIPNDVGVLFGCAVPTGAGIVTNELKPQAGASAAVFGLGGIGLTALMALAAAGCVPIIAVDVVAEKLDAAIDCGATHVIDALQQDPVFAVRSLTAGQGVDYSIEAAGRARTIEQAFDSVRKFGGQCVFASHPVAGDRIQLDPHDLISGKIIRGTWGGASHPEHDIPLFAQMYRDGRLPLERLLRGRYALEEIDLALTSLEQKTAFRPLIEF